MHDSAYLGDLLATPSSCSFILNIDIIRRNRPELMAGQRGAKALLSPNCFEKNGGPKTAVMSLPEISTCRA
ncbi:hypothetical protein [Dyella sp. GSA-30]|uniref:hypothetical protein n=1 Tax=Dyella sp. GSA-30 TaxID=2994496 RepID=UPI00248F57B8|nr:hypothetical protein [Dyella sp. GSA-30]